MRGLGRLGLGLGSGGPAAVGGGAKQYNGVGARGTASDGTDMTIPLPDDLAENDLMLLVLTATPDGAAHDGPAGWDLLGHVETTGGFPANRTSLTVFEKVAGASEVAPTIIGVDTDSIGYIIAFSGYTVDAFQTSQVSSGSTSLVVSGVTTSEADALVVSIITIGDNAGITAVANADISLTGIVNDDYANVGGNDFSTASYYGTKATAGLVADTTATAGQSEQQANMMISLI